METVAQVPHVIATAPAFEGGIEAFARGSAQRAAAAPATGHDARRQRPLAPSGPLSGCRVHVPVLRPGGALDS